MASSERPGPDDRAGTPEDDLVPEAPPGLSFAEVAAEDPSDSVAHEAEESLG